MYYITEYGSARNFAPLLSVGLILIVFSLTSQDNLPTEEEYSRGPGEDSEEEGRHLGPRILYDNSAESEQDNSDLDNISEPEEVKRAWEELVIIQREQQR